MAKVKKPDDLMTMTGLRLKAARLAIGYDRQDSFAKEIRCTATRYNNWELGNRFPAPDAMVRILQLWGIGPDFIYGGSMRGIPHELYDKLEQTCAELGAVIHAPVAEWPMAVRGRLHGHIPRKLPRPGGTLHEPKA